MKRHSTIALLLIGSAALAGTNADNTLSFTALPVRTKLAISQAASIPSFVIMHTSTNNPITLVEVSSASYNIDYDKNESTIRNAVIAISEADKITFEKQPDGTVDMIAFNVQRLASPLFPDKSNLFSSTLVRIGKMPYVLNSSDTIQFNSERMTAGELVRKYPIIETKK